MYDIFIVDMPGYDWNAYNIQDQFPHAKLVDYESILDIATSIVYQSSTKFVWLISTSSDYTNFNFDYEPPPWEASQIHCWASNENKFGETFLIPVKCFKDQRPYLQAITEYKDINWHEDIVPRQPKVISSVLHDICIMNMGDRPGNVEYLTDKFPHARIIRYYNNHLDTIKRCVSKATSKFIWVISSCCDYTDFDFRFVPPPWEEKQIHCWASGSQKFGDTFLIPVEEFKAQSNIELLEWYYEINWHENGVPRFPFFQLDADSEDITGKVRQVEFGIYPYVWINGTADYDPQLWKNRQIHTFNRSNSVALVPAEVRGQIGAEMYDYPHILKHQTGANEQKPLDIVYVSNGEPDAERWYEHLCKCAGREVRRVSNVPGRMAAYKAAANMSDTPWFFAVFAKFEVDPGFDWNWQPDYLQEPKHYIFRAKNPVNGLEYGHMSVLAYNKRLTLDTHESGLDFTLSKPHCVIPVLSGVAHYNVNPWTTWRTAFREVLKLKNDQENIDSKFRLKVWSTTAAGPNAEWSLKGAADAIAYYDEVNGEFEKLMLSYDWPWLRARFDLIFRANS